MPFGQFGLHADIVRGVKDLAFTRPTPIQEQAIPPAMEGKDLLACAATGSGKTAAFMLPTIHHLMTRPGRGARALVLTPTRELAAQIHENLGQLAVHTPITGAAVFGGVGMYPQEHAFRSGVNIIVATPGRLLDHMRYGYVNFAALEILIMDEADRMLDMGFLPDIRRILQKLPTKRQTLFFSATMPNEIRKLTQEMLKSPVTIQIDRQATPAVGITQAIYPVPQHLKGALLVELLKNDELNTVICFTRTKHRANRLTDYLKRNNIRAVAIHGNRTQAQRTQAISGFKDGEYRVLVATDIAARGIDIQDVSHVINFDCPHVPEDYIHRIGRTGRASATGDAFTFVAQDEEGDLRQIERAIAKRLPRVTLPEFDYTKKTEERLEVPIAERIAAIRARKSQERASRDAKMARQGGQQMGGYPRQAPRQQSSQERQPFQPRPQPAHPPRQQPQQPKGQQPPRFPQQPRGQGNPAGPGPRPQQQGGQHAPRQGGPHAPRQGGQQGGGNAPRQPGFGNKSNSRRDQQRRKQALPGHGGGFGAPRQGGQGGGQRSGGDRRR